MNQLLRKTALLDTYVAHIFASRSHLAPPRISYRPSKCKPPLDTAGRRSVRRYNMRGDGSMHPYGGCGTAGLEISHPKSRHGSLQANQVQGYGRDPAISGHRRLRCCNGAPCMFVHHVAELEFVERRSDRDTAKKPLPAMKQLAHLDTVHDSFALRIASSSPTLSILSATLISSHACFRLTYRSR